MRDGLLALRHRMEATCRVCPRARDGAHALCRKHRAFLAFRGRIVRSGAPSAMRCGTCSTQGHTNRTHDMAEELAALGRRYRVPFLRRGLGIDPAPRRDR